MEFSTLQQRFKAMAGETRENVLQETANRHAYFYDSIVPRSGIILGLPGRPESPRIVTISQAQTTLLLEHFYACIYDLLKLQNTLMQRMILNRAELPKLRDDLEHAVHNLRDITDQGDWNGLLGAWRQSLRVPKTQPRLGLRDRLRRELDHPFRDLPETRRILGMVPAHSQPMNPKEVDTNPPIL